MTEARKKDAAPDPAPKTGKTAILVIHGIGQQDPYETLDHFARGLADHFHVPQAPPHVQPLLEPLLISHEGWNEVALRLTLRDGATRLGCRTLDLYEFYWAPYTEGKISYLQTLKWLRRTVLTPLRYLASAYVLFDRPEGEGKAGAAFFREVFRILFLFLPVAALTFLLGYLIAMADRIQPTLSGLAGIWRTHDFWRQAGLVAWVGSGILAATMIRTIWVLRAEERLSRRERVRSLSAGAIRRWMRYAWVMLAVSTAAFLSLTWWLRSDLLLYWKQIVRWHSVLALVVVVTGQGLRRILVGYVGDIAVYVNADAKAASYEARSKILKEAREAVLRLLRSPEEYERIVLAGHSLGSVISYDLLNRLLNEVRASYTTGPKGMSPEKLGAKELEKIRGLLTFGSPLDKIYYFFRTEVPAQQPIRAQILSFMHGFRRAPSGRSYGDYEFPRYEIPEPSRDFKWINIWAPADPVSGRLDFYQVADRGNPDPTANQFQRPYPWYRWGYAHVMYWSDPGFYALVAEGLL